MKKLLIFIIAILIVSCSGKSENELKGELDSYLKDKKFSEAEKTLEIILNDYPDSKSNDSLIFEFAKLYHSKVIAKLSNEQNMKNAIKYYEKLYNEYPKSENAPTAMFMCGFIYANELKDFGKAKEYYNKFLKSFPNHELSASAKIELENLGVPPDEIIKKYNGTK